MNEVVFQGDAARITLVDCYINDEFFTTVAVRVYSLVFLIVIFIFIIVFVSFLFTFIYVGWLC